MSKKITWELVEVKASEIKTNPKNPKKRNEKGFKRLQKSLEKFGKVFDGIINTDMTLIDGHSRLEVSGRDEILRMFKPSRKLTQKEYSEMNAIFDMAKAGDIDEQILEEQFEESFFEEWEIDKKEQAAEVDYSILEDLDVDQTIENMQQGVKKAIQIEFENKDYEEAYALVKHWREKNVYVGGLIIDMLKEKKEN
jgi:hypothetical protein